MRMSPQADSTYAPLRYEATRPYALELGKRFMAHHRQGESVRRAFLTKEMMPLVQKEVRRRFGPQDGPGPVQNEFVNVQAFGYYADAGRVIFDVSTALSDSLTHTDIGDIPCGEVPFIARAFYLHFGALTSPDGEYVDEAGLPLVEGAFVQHLPGERFIVDFASFSFGDEYFADREHGDELLGVSIDFSDPSLTVLSALSAAVKRIEENHKVMAAQAAEMQEKVLREYGELVRVPTMGERLTHYLPVLSRAMHLVINTLFYIASEPEDVAADWPPDAPDALLTIVRDESAKPGSRRTAVNTLNNQGYIKVQFVGRRYASTTAAAEVAEAVRTGRTMPTHMRRGHWRRQPYGPERSLRKMVLIAPVLVNPQRAAESPGRIYELGSPPLHPVSSSPPND
jgi:hypothetical protein